jgi:hypothetical protein
MGFVVLVVRFEFFRIFDPFMIEAVLFVRFDSHYDRFVHLVADDFANLRFTSIAFAHS